MSTSAISDFVKWRFLRDLDQLKDLVSALDRDGGDLVCKHFFSGAALYQSGQIRASLTPIELAFKLPETRCDELIADGQASALRYFEKSPIKQGYILLPDLRNSSKTAIYSYFEECLAYASTRSA